MRNLLYPKVAPSVLPTFLALCAAGSAIAGIYGIVHDQITFTLAPEYFTHFKFFQFGMIDTPLSERLKVASVGFQATWWVGLIAAWFLARSASPSPNPDQRELTKKVLTGFAIITTSAIIAGVIGAIWGFLDPIPGPGLSQMCQDYGITNIPAFVLVGSIHNASYAGALCGLILAVVRLRRTR